MRGFFVLARRAVVLRRRVLMLAIVIEFELIDYEQERAKANA
jgi:hypothetical protein